MFFTKQPKLNLAHERHEAKRALLQAIEKAGEAASLAGLHMHHDIADAFDRAGELWRLRWATTSPL